MEIQGSRCLLGGQAIVVANGTLMVELEPFR